MGQWFDDTLIAIRMLSSGRWQVVELPARSLNAHWAGVFVKLDKAEAFIEDQYSEVLRVEYEDILEEQERRKVIISREQEED